MRSSHAPTPVRRRLAAVVTTGLVAGASLLAAPAQAISASTPYTCTIAELPGNTYELSAVHDTDADASMTVGQTKAINGSSVVTIPDSIRAAARFLGATKMAGTAALKSSSGDVNAVIPSTPIPAATGPFDITAAGPAGTLAPTTPGVVTITAGGFTAALDLQNDAGTSVLKANVTCVVKDGSSPVVDTVTVVAQGQALPPAVIATTTTKLTAKYAKSGKATVTATVKAADASSTAGKITVVLKKGSKTLKSVTATVNSAGVAKAVFKKVTAKGKYKVTGSFAGSTTSKPSVGTVTFKVK